MRYCDRCKTSVPLSEWKLQPDSNSWKHIGLNRRVIDSPIECGFVLLMPASKGGG